ncbi:MAG: NAD(P)/FAD-dependent oxidoreductase [Acidimicrobiales bacterium]
MTGQATSVEHLDVLIVGAGLSGICAAHHVQTTCPWADYAILEARDAIGGTWDLFRYPGIRSDSDMFTLGYGFRPWNRAESIADGGSILQYIKDTAAEEGIDRRIRFRHRIVAADWSSDEQRWTVTVQRVTGDPDAPTDEHAPVETVTLTCSFLFSCSGYYRYDQGYLPDFAGMDDFEGLLVHPQHWPEDLEYAGKEIVVIGSGATAITLVPSLAPTAKHVTMLQRSPTYIASLPGSNPLTRLVRAVAPRRVQGPVLKWMNALLTQGSYLLSRHRPELMKRILRKGVQMALPEGFDVDTHFTPRYDPWDQRLCVVPDGDLFTAIRAGTASVVTDHIDTFTPKGVLLTSGEELQADIIVTATGLELLFIGGIELTVDGERVDVSERLTYKGMMLEGVPNFALAIGYTNASWTLKAELISQRVARMLNHMRDRGLASATPVDTTGAASAEGLLDLSSGYVQRAIDRFPKQGTAAPWHVDQNYVLDYRAMKMSDIDDGVMRFARSTTRRSA